MAKVKGKVWKLTPTVENSTFRSKDFKDLESLGGFDSTRYKAEFWFELDITNKCKQALTFICANYPEIEISDVVVITDPLYDSGAFYKNSTGWTALKDLWEHE